MCETESKVSAFAWLMKAIEEVITKPNSNNFEATFVNLFIYSSISILRDTSRLGPQKASFQAYCKYLNI
jgi:hypothetical protein